MLPSGDDHVTIRKYLLGQLSHEDREAFEERYFKDEELFEQLQVGEEDLIDDFLCHSLSPADVDMFHHNFLVGLKREQQLRFGKAWRNYAAAHAGEKPPNPNRNWRQLFLQYAPRIGAAAGLIVVAAIGVIQFIPSEVTTGLNALNAAYKQERPLESRITNLDYAPYDSTRGSASRNVDQNELNEAELTLQRVVNKKPTPEAHHAFGKVFLAKKDFDKAIEQFEVALKGDPNNAQIYADLGAALLEKGKLEIEQAKSDSAISGKGVEDLGHSLENLNKALQLDPKLLEALYNRALVHEAMSLLPEAADDWRKYLEKDSKSKWADEARGRLTKIEQRKTTSETGAEIFQGFLSELNAGNEESVSTTVSNNQNRTGNVVVERLLDTYLESANQNRKEEAIKVLTYIGDLQRRKTGDAFFLT